MNNQWTTLRKKLEYIRTYRTRMLHASIIMLLCAAPMLQAKACIPQGATSVLTVAGRWLDIDGTMVPKAVTNSSASLTTAYYFKNISGNSIYYVAPSVGMQQLILKSDLAAAVAIYGNGNQPFLIPAVHSCI